MNFARSTLFFSVPGRYAKALLLQKDASFSKEFDITIKALRADPVSSLLLNSKHLDKKFLISFMDTLGGILKLSKTFINFLKILTQNNRMNIIADIQRCYDTLWNQEHNYKNVIIFSISTLTFENKSQLENLLGEIFPQKLTISYKIDKTLLGGFLIEVGNMRIDASLLNEIKQIKRMLEAG
jgi:F-type H+-transporting ATPase subunit delta